MMPIEDGKKRLLTSLLLCMAEWTMNVPTSLLLQSNSENNPFDCLSVSVFKVSTRVSRSDFIFILLNQHSHIGFQVLEEISSGGRQKCSLSGGHFSPELMKEFNFNISLDNLKPEEYEMRSFADSVSPTHLNSTRHSLQLAAKMVCSSFFLCSKTLKSCICIHINYHLLIGISSFVMLPRTISHYSWSC